ncbi:hypothetical protein Bbelb_225320 [Branchiostoma belcheri]|nr:hypothetical protein Bbelb_225320 [Branchiostoma belcheri]
MCGAGLEVSAVKRSVIAYFRGSFVRRVRKRCVSSQEKTGESEERSTVPGVQSRWEGGAGRRCPGNPFFYGAMTKHWSRLTQGEPRVRANCGMDHDVLALAGAEELACVGPRNSLASRLARLRTGPTDGLLLSQIHPGYNTDGRGETLKRKIVDTTRIHIVNCRFCLS